MQRAVDLLVVDGLLEGRAGSGTYVRSPRERLRLVRSRHRERTGGRPRGAAPPGRGGAPTWAAGSRVGVPAPVAHAERPGRAPR
ncbi:GntR family transcriptional regulator, partial [Streptomyces sp. NPDC059409]